MSITSMHYPVGLMNRSVRRIQEYESGKNPLILDGSERNMLIKGHCIEHNSTIIDEAMNCRLPEFGLLSTSNNLCPDF
ncbi:hypothetical protein RRG08_027509 [Elysia crispata]|uniref:Uncharacterized protein n=1 Tax=Elysia crispata TaxID=231223 RepID=A0AAE1D3Z3_9GAST|nr:hypothetical protein RRG08_027509 [Elysia crispata]